MLINNVWSLEWMCRKQLVLYNRTKAAITTDARLLEVDTSAYHNCSDFLLLLVPHIRGATRRNSNILSVISSFCSPSIFDSVHASFWQNVRKASSFNRFLCVSFHLSSPSLLLTPEMLRLSDLSRRESDQLMVSAGSFKFFYQSFSSIGWTEVLQYNNN